MGLSDRSTAEDRCAVKLDTPESANGEHARLFQECVDRELRSAPEDASTQQGLAMTRLGKSIEKLATLAPMLPDGNYDVKDLTAMASVFGATKPSELTELLGGLQNLTKIEDHYYVKFAESVSYPLDQKLPGMQGLVKADKLAAFDFISFDLKTDANGGVKLENLKGIDLEVSTPDSKHSLEVKEVSLQYEANGQAVLRAKTEDLAPLLKTALSEVSTSATDMIPGAINLSARIGEQGKIMVESQATKESDKKPAPVTFLEMAPIY